MKTFGIVLLAIGLLVLIYGGIDYKRNRTIMQMGSMEITASENRNVPIPAIAGLAVLVGGVALMIAGARRGARS